MKIKWKELNRGIVLAVILAGGVAVSVVVQNTQFKKNIPEIEQRVKELGDEMTESSVGSGEGVRRRQRAFVMNEYMESKQGSNDMLSMSMGKGSLMYMVNQPAEENGEINSAEFKINNIDVYKAGTDGATVTLDYEIDLDMTGTPEMLLFGEMMRTHWYIEDAESNEGSDKESIDDKRRKGTVEGTYTLLMQKDSGTWKIVNADGYSDLTLDNNSNGGGTGVG